MKRAVGLFFVLILIFGMFPFSLISAQEDGEVSEDIDSETEETIEVMDTPYGAQMRLLQLERAIKRRVLWANAVINVLEEKGENVSELESIVAELELLVEEVQGMPEEDATKRESVEQFINIMMDARDLVKEFREKAWPLLSSEDREALREEFVEIDRTELHGLTSEILNIRRLRHAEMVEAILESMGVEDQELVDKVKNGEITLRELKNELRNKYAGLSDEDKQEFRNKLKENHVNRRVLKAKIVMRARENRASKISGRLSNRASALEAKGFSDASNVVRAKAEFFAAKSENIGARRTSRRNT